MNLSNNNPVLELVRHEQEHLAGDQLPPTIAKLYSQHTRLRGNQPGLPSWSNEESLSRLNDAIHLIEAAFLLRNDGTEWRNCMRRAAELLEWLSHPEINLSHLPLKLLAAAAYQLADYPARASGLLGEAQPEAGESRILSALLEADFPALFQLLPQQWLEAPGPRQSTSGGEDYNPFQNQIVRETASALGILCATLRWGEEPRLEKAIAKLEAVSKVMLLGEDTYSWLLSKLCANVARTYVSHSLRNYVHRLQGSPEGKDVLERYLRLMYQTKKILAWPSQIRGIERLQEGKSFALCTPTGSGKTTVAELAILQSLFPSTANDQIAPIAIYLVPSRALASEVEAKLSRALQRVDNKRVIVVTGLYGGTDWGPTDAWLTTTDRTVLICTYEKGEALIRFLGPLFLDRVSLVVIDEAHSIQFNGSSEHLLTAESRPLRLEVLSARLLSSLGNQGRIIAMSAVAAGVEGVLAKWVTSDRASTAAKTTYRSTRQLIGRLECLPSRKFEIQYDLLDGADLQFEDTRKTQRPYVPNPFPPFPPAPEWEEGGPNKIIRPYALWAAMHLAAPDSSGHQQAVLISVTQHIDWYTKDFLKLLDSTWVDESQLPRFFQEPTDQDKLKLWQRCLLSCEDYFSQDSYEYQLLVKGIVVHHGKMPGLMTRLLVEVVEEKIVHIVIATSTLSEGINLPFEVVLIPSLERQSGFTVREFSNLVGRAGRPGVSTEGKSLVLLPSERLASAKLKKSSIQQARHSYSILVDQLRDAHGEEQVLGAESALATLLRFLWQEWMEIDSGPGDKEREFYNWLEHTAPLQLSDQVAEQTVVRALDSLDAILLAVVVELERSPKEIGRIYVEEHLQHVWQHTYAFYAQKVEKRFEEIFVRRGVTLRENVYPEPEQRKRLYHTNLPPRVGTQLLALYPRLREHLIMGGPYAEWEAATKFNYLKEAIGLLASVSKFNLPSIGTKKHTIQWHEILKWWLEPSTAGKNPSRDQIGEWHKYISQNFQYRANWGLSSMVAIAVNEAHGGHLQTTTLDDWLETGLPWIVLWIKELLIWGTLDPVAASVLSYRLAYTRSEAESLSRRYYREQSSTSVNEILDARKIRAWIREIPSQRDRNRILGVPPEKIQVELLRDFSKITSKQWRVLPVQRGTKLYWYDCAGYLLAVGTLPAAWSTEHFSSLDFHLDPLQQLVTSEPYL